MEGARVSLKGWQQAAVALGSALGALMDPRRADLVAALDETTGKPAFFRVLKQIRNSREGRTTNDGKNSKRSLPTYFWKLKIGMQSVSGRTALDMPTS